MPRVLIAESLKGVVYSICILHLNASHRDKLVMMHPHASRMSRVVHDKLSGFFLQALVHFKVFT